MQDNERKNERRHPAQSNGAEAESQSFSKDRFGKSFNDELE
jgi:hypothetical protein